MSHLTVIAIFQLLVVCLLPLSLAAPAKNLVVFGDSYADVGNFQRWTNGPLWSEDVAVGWNASLYSFAYSGASCDNDLFQNAPEIDATPSVKDQIEMFYKLQLDLDPIETVFAIWVGVNDIQKAELEYNENNEIDLNPIAECLSQQIHNIRKVFRANRIMVFNVPPLEHMPFFADGHAPEDQRAWGAAALKLNALLQQEVINLNKHHHALELDLVDVHSLLIDIVTEPAIFGFADSTTAYLDARKEESNLQADDYVWWDHTHFTGGVHLAIANSILLSGSYAPTTFIDPARVDVQALLNAEHSPYRSNVYVAQPNTGLIDRLVDEMTPTFIPGRNDVDDDYEFDLISFWHCLSVILAFCLVVAAVTSVWKKHQQAVTLDGVLDTPAPQAHYYAPLHSVDMSEK